MPAWSQETPSIASNGSGNSNGNASSNANGSGCAGVDPLMPEDKYSKGMQFIVLHNFESTRDAIKAARKENIELTIEDMCFLVKRNELAQVGQNGEESSKTATTFKPECEGKSETHACNGGGVQAGEAGDGKRYLENIAKDADVMNVLRTIVTNYDPVSNPNMVKVGLGDLKYHFYDMTPESMYEQQVQNTATTIDALSDCLNVEDVYIKYEDISKCTVTESPETAFLKSKNPSSAQKAIELAEKESTPLYLGMGALQKHYTKAPGEEKSEYEELLGGGGSGSGGNIGACDPKDPNCDPNAGGGDPICDPNDPTQNCEPQPTTCNSITGCQ